MRLYRLLISFRTHKSRTNSAPDILLFNCNVKNTQRSPSGGLLAREQKAASRKHGQSDCVRGGRNQDGAL